MGAFKSKSKKTMNVVPFAMTHLNEYWDSYWTKKHKNALYKSLESLSIPNQMIIIIEEYAAELIPGGPSSIIITRKYDKMDWEKLKKQHLDDIHHVNEFNLAVFGKTGSGKSSLVIRKITDNFIADYDATIEDSYRKRVAYDDNAFLFDILDTIDIFDQDIGDLDAYKWQNILKETKMAFILFDLSNYESWDWIKVCFMERFMEKQELNDKKYPMVLVGTKCDLMKRDIPPSEIKEFIVQYDVPYIECSAMNKINIEELFYIGYQEGYAQLGLTCATI